LSVAIQWRTNALAAAGDVPSASAGSVGGVADALADGDDDVESDGSGAGSGAASVVHALSASSSGASQT
jgi:hypothetical protein